MKGLVLYPLSMMLHNIFKKIQFANIDNIFLASQGQFVLSNSSQRHVFETLYREGDERKTTTTKT